MKTTNQTVPPVKAATLIAAGLVNPAAPVIHPAALLPFKMPSYLLSVEADAKTDKGTASGYLTGILYLAPGQLAGKAKGRRRNGHGRGDMRVKLVRPVI